MFSMSETLDFDRLARRAYQAYGESVEHRNYLGFAMPEFDELGEKIQDAWRAAVRSVVDACAAQ